MILSILRKLLYALLFIGGQQSFRLIAVRSVQAKMHRIERDGHQYRQLIIQQIWKSDQKLRDWI